MSEASPRTGTAQRSVVDETDWYGADNYLRGGPGVDHGAYTGRTVVGGAVVQKRRKG